MLPRVNQNIHPVLMSMICEKIRGGIGLDGIGGFLDGGGLICLIFWLHWQHLRALDWGLSLLLKV